MTVLFDLDGTLIDSQPGIDASLRHMLAALGHHPGPAADLTWAIGPPLAEAVTRLLAEYGDDRVAEGVALYRARYGETGIFEAAAYPGIRAALLELGAMGEELYVATAKRVDFARRVLDRFALGNLFQGIYGALPQGGLERKTDLIAHLLVERGIKPWNAIMVGDRAYDIAAGRANGLKTIGALWGYGDPAELAGADALVTEPSGLVAVIGGVIAGR